MNPEFLIYNMDGGVKITLIFLLDLSVHRIKKRATVPMTVV